MNFDTGSSWLWIYGSDCENCPDFLLFDYTKSRTFELISTGKSLFYAMGEVHGIIGSDFICLRKQTCVDSFNFVVVQKQRDLNNHKSSGLVGLSHYHNNNQGDLFLLKMKETGTIDSAMFSLSISMGNVQSKITFGGYDTEIFATAPLQWHDIVPLT